MAACRVPVAECPMFLAGYACCQYTPPWTDLGNYFTQVLQGPHRLVVRTSRCGRNNPGSTPGVDNTLNETSNEVLEVAIWGSALFCTLFALFLLSGNSRLKKLGVLNLFF